MIKIDLPHAHDTVLCKAIAIAYNRAIVNNSYHILHQIINWMLFRWNEIYACDFSWQKGIHR
jgi:hypothetical protein